MGVLLGYVWTEAVTVKIFTRFQIYTGTCGRGLRSHRFLIYGLCSVKELVVDAQSTLVSFQSECNKTPAEAFTPPAEKKICTKWALCKTAQAGNIKSGYLRILLYIAVVLCLVIGQLHVPDKCVYHAICR